MPAMFSTCKDIRGFTLVELMIVMIIIIILGAIGVPSFVAYRTRANIASVTATGESIRAAMAMYATSSEGNTFPIEEWADGLAGWGALNSFMSINGSSLKKNMRQQGFQDFVYVPLDAGGVLGSDYLFVFQTVGVPATKFGALIEVRPSGVNRWTGSL